MSDPSPSSISARRRGDLPLLLLLFAVFRLLSLALFRPGGFLADFSDFYYYREFAALSDRGLYPYVNIWSPYPPLFPWLLVGLYRLSLLLPPWEQPQLVFNTLLGATLILAECGTLLLVYTLAGGRKAHGRALRSALFYALLFLPAYTAQAHFDSLPVFLMLLGLWLALSGRWALAGLTTGLGVMTKLLPALVLPVGLRRLAPDLLRSWRPLLTAPAFRYALAFLIAVLLIATPFLYRNPRLLLAPLDIQRLRPPWQTVWALLDGYYGFGVAPGDVRDLTVLERPAWEGRVPYGALNLALVALYAWLYLKRADWRSRKTAVAFTGLSLVLLFEFSKGWSPQYLLWLLPLLAVLWPGWRGAAYALSLTAVNYLESHGFFILLPEARWLLVFTTVARAVLLALLAGTLVLEYLDLQERHRRWWRGLAMAPAALTLVALPLLTGPLLHAYTESRYRVEPARPAVEALAAEAAPGAAVYFLQPPDLERFYPHLHRSMRLRTLDERAPDGDLVRHLEEQLVAGDPAEIWLVQPVDGDFPLAEAAHAALDGLTYPLGESVVGPYRLSRWLPRWTLRQDGLPVVFSESIALLGRRAEASGDSLAVTLAWQAVAPLSAPLSAFVHLAPEGSPPAAQDDGPPAWPWPEGEIVADRRAFSTLGLPPGAYRLTVGLYHPDTGDRLTLSDGSDHLDLATVEIGRDGTVTLR